MFNLGLELIFMKSNNKQGNLINFPPLENVFSIHDSTTTKRSRLLLYAKNSNEVARLVAIIATFTFSHKACAVAVESGECTFQIPKYFFYLAVIITQKK